MSPQTQVFKPAFAEVRLDFQEGSLCKCYRLEYLDVYSLGVEKSSTRCMAVPLLLADEERYICLHTHIIHAMRPELISQELDETDFSGIPKPENYLLRFRG